MTGDLISRQAVLDAINSHHQITHIRAAVEAIPTSDTSAQIAAAYEAASALPGTSDWRWRFEPSWSAHELAEAIRALTPADAEAALQRVVKTAWTMGFIAGKYCPDPTADADDIWLDNRVEVIATLKRPEASHER